MVLWFLSLFSAYREACVARIRAEDEVRFQRSRADKAESRAIELTKELLDTKNRVIDVLSRKMLGTNVFAEADPDAIPYKQSIAPGRREQAPDLRSRMEKEFVHKLAEFYSDANNAS